MKLIALSISALLLALGPVHAKPAEIPRAIPVNPTARVVLVHGFLDTGTAFRFIRKRLEKRGVHCIVPDLHPSDGRGGLEGLAERLKADIDAAFGPKQPISIVAFSMGGLVSRYYLQNLGGSTRCEKLFTISSPHNGTHTAWLYPSKGAEQMRPGSPFLAKLNASQSELGEMTIVSYRTPLDLVILPASSSNWERAENLEYNVLMHPMMLSSSSIAKDLEQRLLD